MFENNINDKSTADSLQAARDLQIEANFSALLEESDSLFELVKDCASLKKISDVCSNAQIISVNPKNIILDERLDVRIQADQEIVKNWASLMREGERFPAVDLIRNNDGELMVVDGVLRLRAALDAGLGEIDGRILDCDAVFAFGVKISKNSSHGLPLTTRGRKPYAMAFLRNPKSAKIKARRIADLFHIDNHTVAAWRDEIKNGEIPQNSASENSVEYPPFRDDINRDAEQSDAAAAAVAAGESKDSAETSKVKSQKKQLAIPGGAVEANQVYRVEFGDRYRVDTPNGDPFYLLCNNSADHSVLKPLYHRGIVGQMVTDPTYGTDVPAPGRDFDNTSDKPYFENIHITPADLELLLLNVLSNGRKCMQLGATYCVFISYYQRSMFETVCDKMLGKHHMSLYWVKHGYVMPKYSITGWDTEEALLGWVRGNGKPQRTEGKGNSFLGCRYREDGSYSRREFVEKSEYDVGGEYHPCSKPVFLLKQFIERYSKPGAVVLDPFFGSGSTAIACLLSGRLFVGIEFVPEYVAVCLKRLAALGCTIRKMEPEDDFWFPDSVGASGIDSIDDEGDEQEVDNID